MASGAPQALLAGEATSTELSLKAAPVALTFDGKAAVGAATKVTGNLKLDVPSVRDLADWAGQPITMQGSGLGPLAISGQVDATPTNIAFRGAEIKLDGMTAKGELAANTAGKVPRLTGRLDFDKLDLNPYIGGEPTKSETGSAAGSGGSSSAPAPAAQPTDWSDEPIDASGLRAAEADLAISTGAILVNEIKVGRTALKVALAGGKLVADLNELNLYQGKGKGRFVIAALKQGVRIEEQFDLQSVQAEPLLMDAAAFDRLTGTANASFRLNASGATERALVSSLAGDGKVTFLDGAIRGINLAAMVRQTSLAALNQSVGGSSQTDFAELSGSFTATDGVVRNDDLLMKAPLLRLTGNGTVRMPPKTLNYRFEPKVVGTLEGQGGATQAGGLMVPVIAEGPWHDLKYRPDLEGLVKQGIAGGDAKKLLEGLVKPKAPATTGDTGAAAPAPKPKDVLKDALKGLFKSN